METDISVSVPRPLYHIFCSREIIKVESYVCRMSFEATKESTCVTSSNPKGQNILNLNIHKLELREAKEWWDLGLEPSTLIILFQVLFTGNQLPRFRCQ